MLNPRACVLSVVLVALPFGCTHEAEQPTHDSHPHDHEHLLHLPPVGATIKVSFDGKSVDVPLASVPVADGAPRSISFTQLWTAAWPAADAAQLKFDFVGSDGFRSMSQPRCTRLLTGADLTTARLEVATHNLVLDDVLKLPGCYRVRAVVTIDATR